jgi:hypothetical protein
MDLLADKEAMAIQSKVSSLAALAPDGQRRVLAYLNLRYEKNGSLQHDDGGRQPQLGEAAGEKASAHHTDIATLFENARPQSCSERALVAGYWFQVEQAEKDFESRALTQMVAELGHPTKNITRDVRALLGATPKLMIQVGRGSSGASRRYRLTTEGVRTVEKLLAGDRP